MLKQKNKAFTILKLLVVVAIIAILAVIAIPQFGKAIDKSKDSLDLAEINSVSKALGNYYSASLPLYQFLEDNFRSYSIILDENDEMAISFTTDQLYDEYSKLVDDVLSAQDTSNSALNKFQAEKSKVLKQRGISSSSQEKLYQSLMNQ